MEASDKTGWYGGYMTDKEIADEQSKNKNFTGVKAKEYQKEIDDKYGKKTEDPKVEDTTPVTTPVTKPEPPTYVDPGLGDDEDDDKGDPTGGGGGSDIGTTPAPAPEPPSYEGPGYDDPYDSGGGDSGDDDSGDSGGGGGGGGGGGKIICTTMNKMYGLPMYSNRVWMRYNKYKKLDSAWELGYHKIFLSLVKQMPTNKYIRNTLEWFA